MIPKNNIKVYTAMYFWPSYSLFMMPKIAELNYAILKC